MRSDISHEKQNPYWRAPTTNLSEGGFGFSVGINWICHHLVTRSAEDGSWASKAFGASKASRHGKDKGEGELHGSAVRFRRVMPTKFEFCERRTPSKEKGYGLQNANS